MGLVECGGRSEGDIVEVQVTGKEPSSGKLKLSRRVLLPKPEGYVERP